MIRPALVLLLATACAPEESVPPIRGDLGDGKADRPNARAGDIVSMSLKVDLASHEAIAELDVVPDGDGRLALDVHGLDVKAVSAQHDLTGGRLLLEGLPSRAHVRIGYTFDVRRKNDGLLGSGSTLVWPYHCGNLFPCHTEPSDGMTFEVSLINVPEGQAAIFPPRIEVDAPSYMLAWAVGAYGAEQLGETGAGTRVDVFYLPRGKTAALAGTNHLVDVFDWLERTIGDYAFGHEVGSVSVRWGAGALGGMEHHPYWHVAEEAMADDETHAHEAAHGWFGDGVRIRCWEDFVLSEGSASYLAARALGQVAGATAEAQVWDDYHDRLLAAGEGIAWPRGCNQIDIIRDGLFSDLPYMRGAFFLRAVAHEVGEETLDQVMATFYRRWRGKAAGMADLLDAIEEETGFDPSPLAEQWLRRAALND